jgi:hypothetical protein
VITIKSDLDKAIKRFRNMPASVFRRAMRQAINRGARVVRTKTSRDVAKQSGLKRTRVLRAMHLLPAKGAGMTATIRAKGPRIGLSDFRATRQNRVGVRSMAYGESKQYPTAFLARMKNGHVGVFRRSSVSGKRVARLKILELYGPSIAETMGDNFKPMDRHATKLIRKEFWRLVRVYVRASRRVLP